MAWILRFLNNARRREKFVCELTATELTVARKYWVLEEAFKAELQLLLKNLPLPRGSKWHTLTRFWKMDLSNLAVDYIRLTSLESNNTHCYSTAPIAEVM